MTSSPLAAKSIPLHLVILKNTPIYEQLQLEEALLRADQHNWCLINRGSPPAIVVGISGKPELLLNQELLALRPIPVIRRFSGGGTVFIDPNTFFITWICNADHSGVACCPAKLYQWTTAIYQQAFPLLQIKLVENDYVIGKHKFGGNAQYLCKGRWLHHSSLLWDYHPDNMDYLEMPAKRPAYRQDRTHQEFLCRLSDHVESLESWESFLLEGIRRRFEVKTVSKESLLEILERPHRKGTLYI